MIMLVIAAFILGGMLGFMITAIVVAHKDGDL